MESAFDRTMSRYGLDPKAAAAAAAELGVDERLVVELVHLASVKYRTVDRWGHKTAFEWEVGELIGRFAQGRDAG